MTLANRGRSNPDLFAELERVPIDRSPAQPDLSGLRGRDFDATIDVCAYWPGQVRALAAALEHRGGWHLHVSSVSAYADPVPHDADESAPLAPLPADGAQDPDGLAMTASTYGPPKAACEQTAVELFGSGNTTIVRPTYVVGPHDPTGRFTWWPNRVAHGGTMLCPGPHDASLQVIDARDQATWALGLLERGVAGAFHACSPAPPWSLGDLVQAAATALGADVDARWWPAEAEELAEHGVDGASFPLWSAGEDEGGLALDPTAAYATGLTPRPIEQTICDTYTWMQGHPWQRDGVGLTPEREADLLATLRAGG